MAGYPTRQQLISIFSKTMWNLEQLVHPTCSVLGASTVLFRPNCASREKVGSLGRKPLHSRRHTTMLLHHTLLRNPLWNSRGQPRVRIEIEWRTPCVAVVIFTGLAIEHQLIAASLRHLRRRGQLIQKEYASSGRGKELRRHHSA